MPNNLDESKSLTKQLLPAGLIPSAANPIIIAPINPVEIVAKNLHIAASIIKPKEILSHV